jgi:3-phenylpropionate/trans-cinnamate dioxygenase ferredoxin reductase component
MPKSYEYIIIGGGLTGSAAVDGIRERDPHGSILLLGAEPHLPYNRPPLSKDLWFGKETVENIFTHPEAWYADNGVEVKLETRVEEIEPSVRVVTDHQGEAFSYAKLLLATGGTPRTLDIPGGDFEDILYYRTLADYGALREKAQAGKSAVVIGGGFIGSEIAAALQSSGVQVTMVFRGPGMVSRVFPADLAASVRASFIEHGVRILDDTPAEFTESGGRFTTVTKAGERIESDMIVAGIGILPNQELAADAGIECENGVIVDEFQQTQVPNVYAAGDVAQFPYKALDQMMRIEHWDHARKHGKQAGLNMAGAEQPYEYLPYFFSDLFEVGYEAVGEADASLETFAVWQEEFKTGIVYYLRDRKVRGVMACNVWKKMKPSRELITSGREMTDDDLRKALE